MRQLSAAGVRFELVVEIATYEMSDRPFPEQPASEADWAAYFDACDADLGIGRLTSIEGSRSLYCVRDLDDHATGVAADHRIKDVACLLDETSDQWTEARVANLGMSLNGGLAILDADGVRVAGPGCCCGLEVLAEWQRTRLSLTDEWQHPWCGHGAEAIAIRLGESGDVEFEVTHDAKPAACFSLANAKVARSFGRLNEVVQDFARRLDSVLAESIPDAGARRHLARSLAGLPMPPA